MGASETNGHDPRRTCFRRHMMPAYIGFMLCVIAAILEQGGLFLSGLFLLLFMWGVGGLRCGIVGYANREGTPPLGTASEEGHRARVFSWLLVILSLIVALGGLVKHAPSEFWTFLSECLP